MPKRMTQEEFERRVADYTQDTIEVIGQYKNKHEKVTVRCKKCGYEWEFSPTSLMPSNMEKHKFGGCPECLYETVKCSYCGKEIRRLKSTLNTASGYIYCSKECGNRHKNTFLINTQDSTYYRRNAFLKYPHKCAVCNWNEDERLLEVHHIDENRQNNNIDNLIILCPICHKKLTLHLYSLQDLLNKSHNIL